MKATPFSTLILATLLSAGACALAEFPAPYNSETGTLPLTPPQDALKALHLPEGFRATLFAAEPDVQNPIAMAWDSRGRMWVAENYTYAERAKRFDLGLRDRVIILEDKDWDGRAETRKVFTDDVQMLTSIEVGRGGVWLMCPPQLLFIPDRNGDDIPDGPPEVILDGFTVAKDNYHNYANGLHWGPDGWLYGRCGHSCPGRIGVPGTPDELRVPIKGGIWRFHPERKIVEVLTHGTTNPWGHDWDKDGECFFINTVTGHLWHLIHGAHLKDSNPSLNPAVYERLDTIADHYHFDTKGNAADLRGASADKLGGGHAHIGMMIYQADQWPASWRDKLFTLNMHGRRTNVERLERHGSSYIGRHEPDVFLSDDPWFRGLEISTGPDGSGFVLDWSDIGECHEGTGVHRTSGRIFRISYGEAKKPDFADLRTPDAAAIERLANHPNAWFRRQLLVQKGPPPIADPMKLLQSRDEHDRVRAIRLLTDFWPLDTIVGPLPGAKYPDEPAVLAAFTKLAAEDPSGLVRLTLASTLQRLPVEKRVALATALVSRTEDANDAQLPAMVWYGLIPVAERDADALLLVAPACTWPKTLRWMARHVAGQIEKRPEAIDALLTLSLADENGWRRLAVLEGTTEAFRGWRKAPKPSMWDRITAPAPSGKIGRLTRELSVLFGDDRALDDVKAVALDSKADLAARQAALKTLIDSRPPDLREICMKLLDVRTLNGTAVRGLALFDDPEIGAAVATGYRKFHPIERPAAIDTLSSRPAFAKAMLAAVGSGTIPRADITAFHARQIRAFANPALTKQLAETWGEMRETTAEKGQAIAKLKSQLGSDTLAKADLGMGRKMFQEICAVCHSLYGNGGKIGPDLTGSGRANLDYLLENIVDPNAVVGAEYRMNIVTLRDGRILSGIIAESNARTLTLRTLTESVPIERASIAKEESAPVSMMPEGLLLALQPDQVRDLIAYLMHPVQVPLPGK